MVNFPFRIAQVLSVWRRAQRRNRNVQIGTRGFRAAHGAFARIDWLPAARMVNFPFRISQVLSVWRRAQHRNRSVQMSTRGFRAPLGGARGVPSGYALPRWQIFPSGFLRCFPCGVARSAGTGIYKSVYEDSEQRTAPHGKCLRNPEGKILVGDTRFELVTSAMSRQRSNQLS